VDDHVRALFGISPRNRGANALAGAGYDYRLVVKIQVWHPGLLGVPKYRRAIRGDALQAAITLS
jgi:hypothetical protein